MIGTPGPGQTGWCIGIDQRCSQAKEPPADVVMEA